MQHPAARAGSVAGREQGGVRGERAVGDRVADAHERLRHDPSGAEVEVADLGVAHLAVGQADIGAGGGERVCGIVGQSSSKTGRSASETALPGPGGREPSPSRITSATGARGSSTRKRRVRDREQARRGQARTADQRAVDIRHSASSSRAFSGLTEPP